MHILNIENPLASIEDLKRKFLRLHDRFLGVAMDYKFYIKSDIKDDEIHKLRNNVLFRLQSARFHYKLLIDYHLAIEKNLKNLHQNNFNTIQLHSYEINSTEEIYSLFDSFVYHLCSNFDYLFRLVNFIHGKTDLKQPKWNLFRSDKNIKDNLYCSKELIEELTIIDDNFVYPLIKHRSFLIHNEFAVGNLILFNDLESTFLVSKSLKNHFPELTNEYANQEITLIFAANWLINKTFQAITQVLFAIKDDIIRNNNETQPLFFMIDSNNKMQSPSQHYWGRKEEI